MQNWLKFLLSCLAAYVLCHQLLDQLDRPRGVSTIPVGPDLVGKGLGHRRDDYGQKPRITGIVDYVTYAQSDTELVIPFPS